jgi:translation initiation factor IF-1
MIFPKGAEVQESVNNEWSTVRVKARGENAFSLVAYVSGSARMSTVKITAR